MSGRVCPVCQSEMREARRENVMIDTCPRCRGVWLDRGELEKIIGLARSDMDAAYAEAPPEQRYAAPLPHYQQRPPHDRYDDDDRRYGKYGKYGHRKKSKLESLFDIFD